MKIVKRISIGLGILIVILAIAYAGVSQYFMDHFYEGTTINGIDVSKATEEAAEEAIQSLIEHYELKVNGRGDYNDVITGDQIGLVVAWDNLIGEFLEAQEGYDWIFKIWEPNTYEVPIVVKYDEDKLLTAIEALACLDSANQITPSDAGISGYHPEKGYKVIPAVQGNTIDKAIMVEGVKESVLDLKTELDLESLECYLKPEIVDETPFQTAADNINKVLSTVVTYQIGESTEVFDKNVFAEWVTFNDALEVCIDEEQVAAYVKSLASKYNTCYNAKKLMTSYGQEVKITTSYYGWKVNTSAEKKALLEELWQGAVVTRDLNYTMTANSHEGPDYGNSYVEINLTAQHLFMYVDGELIIETDFVSGDISEGNGTPTGAFTLTYKKKGATLSGSDYSSDVDYWMPFFNNYGMHDATWRKKFGASIYKRNGSHGCINLPPASAEVIFKNIKKGFPVLVYELEGTQSEKGIAQDQAYVVIDAIAAIGTVTVDSGEAIANARTQYDALSKMAKGYVTNYKKLTNAEKAYKALVPEIETELEIESIAKMSGPCKCALTF